MKEMNGEEELADGGDARVPHGVSGGQAEEQREAAPPILIEPRGEGEPTAHVVLFQPQIPQNTGNIGRSCVATESVLWIVRPAAFSLDERAVRRAGLDYWQFLDLRMVDDWPELKDRLPENAQRRYWYFTRFATRPLWEAEFARGDVLVFGSETAGLPLAIRGDVGPRALRLPMTGRVRSLNLSNTVAVALYELLRQTG